MSNVAVLEFNAWLIQPGNHRLLLRIKEKLSAFLNKDIEIYNWQDIYNLFEESFHKNEQSKELFKPVFAAQPPSEIAGASPKQVLLYRGAFVDKSVLEQPNANHVKSITYRGQKIEKRESVSGAETDEKETSGSARYYRGVRIG